MVAVLNVASLADHLAWSNWSTPLMMLRQQPGLVALCDPPVIASMMETPLLRAAAIWFTMVLGLLSFAESVNGVVVEVLLMSR